MNDHKENQSPDGGAKPKLHWSAEDSFARRLRNYFITGIVVAAPIAITVFLVVKFAYFVAGIFEPLIPTTLVPESYLPFAIPSLGLLVAFVFLSFVGALTTNFLGRWLIRTSDRVVSRMPVVRSVYGTLKKIFETVLAQSSKSFREVVLIEYPRPGIWAIGFVTGTAEGEIQSITTPELVNVFLPTTPNPTSGFLLFVPRADVLSLHMSVEEGIKLVISGGIMVPPDGSEGKANVIEAASSPQPRQSAE